MICPFCDKPSAMVIRTEDISPGLVMDGVRRMRRCRDCGECFRTVELIESPCDVLDRIRTLTRKETT